jgi:hypothetical protein
VDGKVGSERQRWITGNVNFDAASPLAEETRVARPAAVEDLYFSRRSKRSVGQQNRDLVGRPLIDNLSDAG